VTAARSHRLRDGMNTVRLRSVLLCAPAVPEDTAKLPSDTTPTDIPESSAAVSATVSVGVVPVTVPVLMTNATSVPSAATSTAVPLVVPAALSVAPANRLGPLASRT
jgi:hypothetical protein